MQTPPVVVSAGTDLELRLLDEDDAVALHRAIDDSREHLASFMPFATNDPSDLAFRRSWIGQCREAFFAGQRFQYGIIRADEVIGGGSIDPVDDRTASIGFWVHVAHVRQGVASAVAAALTQAALEAGCEIVRIRHDRANGASGSIAGRLGYERIGEEPHSIDAPGQTGTSVVWALTRTVRRRAEAATSRH
jgi:RimJ/RimL family protein N-acetyltransferase